MRTLAAACEASPAIARRVLGIHLEGPYVSPEDGPRGAHPRQHCKAPDWDEFQRWQAAAGGRICIITLAPEWDGSPDFIRKTVDSGVLVAIGHTAADSDAISAAVDAGARLSTHLGNGAHGTIRRHPNYIWDQLAEDRLTASIIADGHHLPAAVVKSFVRAKTPERCILVSDASGLAGLPPGRYDGSLCDLEILADGKIVLAGQEQYLAGASRPIGECVTRAIRFAELDLTTALDMASRQPLELLGRDAPSLEPGSAADLMLFDLPGAAGDGPLGEIAVRATIVAGERVFGDVAS
jgi:N-acetylglucosamine-6-phosphate deacetylase